MIPLPSLRETVERYEITARKNLGQNFLFDLNITNRIARCAGDLSDCTILEIGSGPGGLTRSLLDNGAKKIIAVERDSRCVNALNEIKNIVGDRLVIIEDDALKINERELLGGEKAKIVANLPYNIATELLFKWLDNIDLFQSLTLMFQKEVAERINGQVRSKAYGRLSIISQWLCTIRHEFDLSPQAFFPPPKVTSSVITLTPREKPLAQADKETLKMVCKATFGQRRKMLSSSLKQLTDNPKAVLAIAGIDPKCRPEELNIIQFCAIAGALK